MHIKLKNVNWKEVYIYLLIISAFISISVFEVFVVIGLLWVIFEVFKKKKEIFKGNFRYPLVIYSGVTVVSTALYAPKMFIKSLEEGIFQLLYFLDVKSDKEQIKKIIYLFLTIGIILSFVVLYFYITKHKIKPIWGGAFEVGQFFGMFSLMAFFVSVYCYKQKSKKTFLFFAVFLFFFAILIFAHKRSPLLGYLVVAYLSIIVLYKNKLFPKALFWGFNILLTISLIGGYIYLSKTDKRFKTFNEMIIGEKPFSSKTLDIAASGRVRIAKDAILIIKNDIKNHRWTNVLIGHGIRSGYYLPHKYSWKSLTKYESIFILSEFIEKGLIGLLAILAIFFLAFKKFLTVKIQNVEDVFILGIFVPLLIHLVGSIFTFFWDALLPMYLLLFKIGEMYFDSKKM